MIKVVDVDCDMHDMKRSTARALSAKRRGGDIQPSAEGAHGKKFFVTEGKHVTSDNMFKMLELDRQTVEAIQRGKRMRRVRWSIARGARPHSPSSTALRMSWKMMSGG